MCRRRITVVLTLVVALVGHAMLSGQEKQPGGPPKEEPKKEEPKKPETTDPWKACEADIELTNGHIFAQVMLNDKGPFRFNLDNGFEWSSVTTATQQKTGAGRGNVDVLKLGNRLIKGGTYVTAQYVPNTDGMLASEHFRAFVVTIDYPKRKIYFMYKPTFEKEREKIKNPRYLKAEKAGPFLVITATIDGKGPFRFCHDTGTDVNFVLLTRHATTAGIGSGKETVEKIDVKSAQIVTKEGKAMEFADTTVHVGNPQGVSILAGQHGYHGTVGNSAFVKHRISLDYDNQQIIVWGEETGKQ